MAFSKAIAGLPVGETVGLENHCFMISSLTSLTHSFSWYCPIFPTAMGLGQKASGRGIEHK